jgi:O-antigen/teichoic acid export membrane protein
MNLVKTSILSFIATSIKMLSMLAINKSVAIFIGPSGLALIGQFQSFSQLSMTVAQGGINAGVTKYTAEYGRDSLQLPALFSTAARISLACSFVVGALSLVFSDLASNYFLSTTEYAYVFVIFGVSLPLFVLNQLLLSIVNGLKEVRTYINANVIQSLYGLIFTTLLVVFFGLHGALIAMVTNQSVVLLVVLWMLRKHIVIHWQAFTKPFVSAEGKKLFGYSVMALTSAASAPVSHLIVRNYLGETLGWDQAGYWQAIWYISTMYLMVVTMALSTYYLPRLSEITDNEGLREELINGYKFIVPVVAVMAGSIYYLKDFIVWFLFTEEFAPMRELFAWQLIGDVFKIAAWLLSYLVLAKAMIRTFVVTEIVFSGLFVGLSIFFVDMYGLVGVTYAFLINYVIYFLVMAGIVTRRIS